MRIIAIKTLRTYWEAQPETEQPIKAWYEMAKAAKWERPADVKAQFPKASIVANNRVVFDIVGGSYRLVVAFHYSSGIGFVRFIGTHREYDRIDVTKI